MLIRQNWKKYSLVVQCEEVAAALFEDTAILPPGPKKDKRYSWHRAIAISLR
jgi:hypothetical protein